MSFARQLALPFVHTPRYEAADFMADPGNDAALAWLGAAAWPQRRLGLWGPVGCGKTHLLHVWAQRADARVLSGSALKFDLPSHPIAIDDADTAPERPLLHVLNAAAEAGVSVLLTGRTPPGRWPTVLPDLSSRLRAITAAEIGVASDALLRALLARLLTGRQLAVPEVVQDWLRLRLPRTAGAMREAAARLDHLALVGGSRVTRVTAARVLAEMTELADDAPRDTEGDALGDTPGNAGEYEDFTHPERQGSSRAPLLL